MNKEKIINKHDKIADALIYYRNLVHSFDSGLTKEERTELTGILTELDEAREKLKDFITNLQNR